MATPTRDQLAAVRGRTIPDVVGTGLEILFCGINPSLYSAYTGHHFARPGNRFWPALYQAGLTPHQLAPAEQQRLTEWGLGITNLVARATARADELGPHELEEGGRRLAALLREHRPGCLAVLGVTAYRTAFRVPSAVIGPQSATLEAIPVWVLPNPSGLNAQWPLQRIAGELDRMRNWIRGSAAYGAGSAAASVRPGPDGEGTTASRRVT
ncbi:G/U mismatch-specific DNA glycosylase [Lipingzhangella sp. LS1_29]|uniref:G/U mismatch-specific DNA glycosylase n=1 Tax=Lipingzhangella rawalii TaxID=2055835 RepID=A0ABU2H0L6_9ACTN|nr:G/U mismatch-specific DNA glycosylase [Lipingzhangella rawalii]MDS1268841.1 G/U mismatch-specific DNA glycosylase [Lipingzhangella rawalii]